MKRSIFKKLKDNFPRIISSSIGGGVGAAIGTALGGLVFGTSHTCLDILLFGLLVAGIGLAENTLLYTVVYEVLDNKR